MKLLKKTSLKNNFLIVCSFLLFLAISFATYYILNSQSKNTQGNLHKIDRQTQDILAKCMKNKDSASCYANEFGKIGQSNSIVDTIAVLKNVQKKDVSTLYCHFIAHKITQSAVLQNPKKWLEFFSKIDMTGCSNGFFHGIVEGYLHSNSDFSLNKTNIEGLCDKVYNLAKNEREKGRARSNCSHGIGHILLVEKLGNIDRAVVVCISLKSELQFSCSTGVFMENAEREALTGHGISKYLLWNEKNALEIEKLCRRYNDVIGRACWQNLAPMYATIAKGNYEKLYSYCLAPSTQGNRDICYTQGAGYMAYLLAQKTVNTNTPLPPLCAPFESNTQRYRSCIRTVVSFITNASPAFAVKLHKFCSNLQTSEIRICYMEAVESLLQAKQVEPLMSFCKGTPSIYKSDCKIY